MDYRRVVLFGRPHQCRSGIPRRELLRSWPDLLPHRTVLCRSRALRPELRPDLCASRSQLLRSCCPGLLRSRCPDLLPGSFLLQHQQVLQGPEMPPELVRRSEESLQPSGSLLQAVLLRSDELLHAGCPELLRSRDDLRPELRPDLRCPGCLVLPLVFTASYLV